MMQTLLVAATLAVSPVETELAAKLPVIFAKAAAHYKALDAAATPLMKNARGEYFTPHGMQTWKTGKKELDMRSVYWWTAGHFPGSLWYLYEATGEEFFKDRATAWTEILAPNSKVTDNHDVGFVMYCSYGNARRLLKTEKYDALLTETAASLSQRYCPELGLIRSWGAIANRQDFLVIPDNLMNLELLEWAAGRKGGERFAKIAESHADVTMKHHFRPDGGCYHVLNYDQREGLLGMVQEIRRGQGAGCETAWSRGQSWAIYGYTMMYRMTGLVRYLDFARKLADYAISHPNMPEDGIPFWDYGAPGEERDSSAASCMASALVELSQYVGGEQRARYRGFAVKQLLSLASKAYFSEGDEVGHFLLKHGVGHKPGKSEIDTPLDYGDYYFLEALVRFRALMAGEASRKDLAARLPAHASLPAGEPDGRIGTYSDALRKRAEAALTEPIPETPDSLYLEFWKTGNRSHYEAKYFARGQNFDALVLAEAAEGKGRYLARIADYANAICDMKSWVLPAHDYSLGGQGTFKGRCLTVDLSSSELTARLATAVQLLGDRLDPMVVRRVKTESERRTFEPLRRELPVHGRLVGAAAEDPLRAQHHWWPVNNMNWNAVCWDNVTCAVLGLVDDINDRARFVDAAMKAAPIYLGGFTPDGYCSEGMGYWNYGYGHHLKMGRLLRNISDGKIDIFTYPIQRAISAYPRSYTLRDGISPAFADGNGAASKELLKIVDSIWPDLPKELPPVSEFPDGQVWLFRDPECLSAAFKGGHNGEAHNHNDVGSYYLLDRGRFVAGDPGGEVYTARTFGTHRYDSKVINSFGHPVPVVGGKLQGTGRNFAAKVLKKERCKGEVALDLAGAYEVPALKSLVRTFAYDRKAKTFTVRDHAVFSEPTAFEDCYVTFGEKANVTVNVLKGGKATRREETIDNPGKPTPHRFAWTFDQPVTEAEIEFTFKGE